MTTTTHTAATAAAPPDTQPNPFPGLRPFEEPDARLFFGREREIVELLGRVMRQHFLAVLGSSGCGKSSVIKAGLIPSLKYERLDDGSPAWRIASMRPGNDPFKQLALALAKPCALLPPGRERAEADVPVTQMMLRRGPLGLVEAVRLAALPPEAKLLVLVDQFEELFRFPVRAQKAAALDEARAFVNLLLAAAAQRDLPVYIVLTMRSEFLGQCAAFRGLAEAITDGVYLLPDMTREQLREVIRRPVAARGGEITERLVNRLLNDLGGQADQLPILQHALMRLWGHWAPLHREGPMDLAHYEVVGELKGSLSAHAESVYERELKDPREQGLAEVLFRSITETTAEGQTVRRPTRLGVICRRAGATHEELKQVVEQFRAEGRSFLMPPLGTDLDDETTIDISHESLIRQWDRLRRWAEAEAREFKLCADLKRDAAAWAGRGREADWLYAGVRLSEAQKWAAAHPNLLDDGLSKEFLADSAETQKYSALLSRAEKWERDGRDESLLLRGRELSESEGWLAEAGLAQAPRPALRRKEVLALVAASRRNHLVTRSAKGVLGLLFVGLLLAAVWSEVQRRSANRQRAAASAAQTVAEARLAELRLEKRRVEEAQRVAESRRSENDDLVNVIESIKPQYTAEMPPQARAVQMTYATAEIRKSQGQTRDRGAVPVTYFYKAEDGTKVADALKAIGFNVATQERQSSAPTNAIWWGEGIALEDVQLIAYTLIQNGFSIQYIGRRETPGAIQIGGRARSLVSRTWTVERVRALTELPEDN